MFTFPKSERINSKKDIDLLMTGHLVKKYPLFIRYRPNGLQMNRILISVPKRQFKKAVDRNRLKRQIREIFRLNKNELVNFPFKVDIFVMYTGKEFVEYKKIEEKYKGLIRTITDNLKNEE